MPEKDWKNAPAKERAKPIIKILAKEYEARCALNFSNAYELLIATILSAQCTDERVNKVTPALFKKYPTPGKMAKAKPEDVEDLIRTTGFYRQKAKSIMGVSMVLTEEYDGEVPQDMEVLTKLPGVGRKTANVVLGTVFGFPAITVDTHVKRLSNRLEFTSKNDPDKIEMDLKTIIPEKEQTDFSHRLIWHGRKTCHAKKPECGTCCIAKYCPSEGKC